MSNASDVIDSPVLHDGNAADVQWRREYQAFLRLLPELLKTYSGRYVAVHDGHVISVADTLSAAAMEAYAKVGYVPLHVGLVSEQPTLPIRIASPRLAR